MSKYFGCNHGYVKRLSVNCISSRAQVTFLPSVEMDDGSMKTANIVLSSFQTQSQVLIMNLGTDLRWVAKQGHKFTRNLASARKLPKRSCAIQCYRLALSRASFHYS